LSPSTKYWPCGNHQLAVAGQALHLGPPVWIDLRIGIDFGGKIVAEGIGRGRLEGRVGLVERNPFTMTRPSSMRSRSPGTPTTRFTSRGGCG
jgi:hypothetical protein